MIHINDLALVSMTGLFAPDMVARGSGRILNVSSVAAFQPGPLMSIYYASKAFVQSFTEALYVELKGTGVKVSVLCPGPTDTPFLEKAGQTEQNMYKKSACVTADKVAAELHRLDLGDGEAHAAHGALAVDHLRRDDVVLLREASVDRLGDGDEALGHRVDGRVEGGGVRRGAADRALLVANEGEFLELDEVVEGASHVVLPGGNGARAPRGPFRA